jgi:hypothetical protein
MVVDRGHPVGDLNPGLIFLLLSFLLLIQIEDDIDEHSPDEDDRMAMQVIRGNGKNKQTEDEDEGMAVDISGLI